MNGARFTTAVCAVVSAVLAVGDADAEGDDKLARGLDVFTQMPSQAPSGATLPVQIQAFGFPTVTRAVPLPLAKIEAAWDPRSLGPASVAPDSVEVTADAAGRAHFDLPVPVGDEREMDLVLSVRAPGHERTRSFKVKRTSALELGLYVNDVRVVPGGAASAWATVQSKSTGQPVQAATVTFDLLEGGIPRFTSRVMTDAGGSASVRIPIPETDEPAITWSLRASTRLPSGEAQSTEAQLSQRDESPGEPRLDVAWSTEAAVAGSRVTFRATLRDAAGEPLAGLPLRYWVGPRGTSAPTENEEWESVSTAVTTDLGGSASVTVDAPRLAARLTTSMTVVARSIVNGHQLTDSAELTIGALLPELTIVPEHALLIPGVEQRLTLRALDARHQPIAARFAVDGDGVRTEVETDERGNGELTWRPPLDVGMHRGVGPCAGGVAAAVRVRAVDVLDALASHREAFVLCVKVDRAATAMVQPSAPLGRAGQPLHFAVSGARKTAWSVFLQSNDGDRVVSGWTDDGERGIDLAFPEDSRGLWHVSAIAPGGKVLAAGADLLVLPRVLPQLLVKMKGGRATPAGKVTVAADLLDENGRGLPGSVAAVMIDLAGGGNPKVLAGLDTRTALTASLLEGPLGRIEKDPFLLAGPAYDPLRRAVLAGKSHPRAESWSDPARDAATAMKEALRDIMHSLEGAVFEGSASPELAREVRRRTARGFDFNPELMTLATEAMDSPPLTPGGEPLTLADLVALDRQITFDNIARRVTRLKVLQVLAAVREHMRERQLESDEPILSDPNALLRRLVRTESLSDGALLDPWGGTMKFVATPGPRVPFLSVRGFTLQAPGPDGRVGTADDIRDPFERVLASGTPYARAVGEDRIVDAKWDMEVGLSTVEAWKSLLHELTGTSLGDASSGEGVGLGSIGTIGHGSGGGGYGEGVRQTRGIESGIAFWSPPRRTDAQGHLELEVPLGDIETTWRLTLVGLPDRATAATTAIDIPVELPLAVQVETGPRWVEGDQVDVGLVARNRTAAPLRALLSARGGGVAAFEGAPEITVDVPPHSVVRRTVVARASRAGEATIDLTARAGALADTVHHTWTVLPAGEPIDLTRTTWVSGESRLSLPGDAGSMRSNGPSRLVMERGFDASLAAALASLEPERLPSVSAVVDALEASTLVYRWALSRGGESDPLARRATDVASRAAGRFVAVTSAQDANVGRWTLSARAAPFLPTPVVKYQPCPVETTGLLDERVAALQAEPPPVNATAACWDAFVGSTLQQLAGSQDALALGRAVLALADRSHRETEAAILTTRLRELVPRAPSGTFVFSESVARDRASRATVLAALLRSIRLGTENADAIPQLLGWMLVQRDAQGGYGSSAATLAVVRALLATPLDDRGTAKVALSTTGSDGSKSPRAAEVPAGAVTSISLDPDTTEVVVKTSGPPLLAQIRSPVIRSWRATPPPHASPLALTTLWPTSPQRHHPAVLKLILGHRIGHDVVVRARVPLPPGASLAEPTTNVHQVRGTMLVTVHLSGSSAPAIIDVPLRFALSGRVTVPEATAHVVDEEAPIAYAPARPIAVKPN